MAVSISVSVSYGGHCACRGKGGISDVSCGFGV